MIFVKTLNKYFPVFTSFYKFLSVSLAVALISGMLVFSPKQAKAGLVVKLPSSLGLSTNLVGHWTFDAPNVSWGENKAFDSTSNNNHGAITSMSTSTAPVMGKIGQGLKFDGVNDYIDAGDINAIDTATSLSGCAWVYHTSLSNDDAIVEKTYPSADGPLFFRDDVGAVSGRTDTYTIFIAESSGAEDARIEGASLASKLNTWTHVCFTYIENAANGLRLYINGTEDANSPVTTVGIIGINGGTNPFVVGNRPDIANGFFAGTIDDVRVYTSALAAGEIKRLYNMGVGTKIAAAQTSKLTTGLVGYWTFDAPNVSWGENKAFDSTSNNNHGNIINMATTTAPVAGRLGQALKFDSTNDYINVGTASSLDNVELQGGGGLTISAWIYPKSNGEDSNATIYDKGFVNSHFYVNNGTLNFQKDFDGASNLLDAATANIISFNQWHHVVVTWNGGALRSGVNFYRNGVAVNGGSGSTNGAGGAVSDASNNGEIGGNTGNYTFDGSIDEVRVYNRVLSAAEITRLYNMGAGTKIAAAQTSKLTTGLVGYWTFDGTDIYESGTKAADKSGNNIAGTISGGRSTVAGKLGQALKFDGTSGGVNMGTNATLNLTGAVTVSAWLNHRGLTSNDMVAGREAGSCTTVAAVQYCLITGLSATQIRFIVSNGVALLQSTTSSTAIQPRTWYHLVGIYNGTDTTSLYVNGVLVDSDTSAGYGALLSPGAAEFAVSQQDTLAGTIDDVRVYNRALSQSEITRLYNMGR